MKFVHGIVIELLIIFPRSFYGQKMANYSKNVSKVSMEIGYSHIIKSYN